MIRIGMDRHSPLGAALNYLRVEDPGVTAFRREQDQRSNGHDTGVPLRCESLDV